MKELNDVFSSLISTGEQTDPSFFKARDSYADRIVKAKTFSEKQAIAREALNEDSLFDKNPINQEYYQRLLDSASADEFITSIDQSRVLGPNTERNLQEFVRPMTLKCSDIFCESFGSSASPLPPQELAKYFSADDAMAQKKQSRFPQGGGGLRF